MIETALAPDFIGEGARPFYVCALERPELIEPIPEVSRTRLVAICLPRREPRLPAAATVAVRGAQTSPRGASLAAHPRAKGVRFRSRKKQSTLTAQAFNGCELQSRLLRQFGEAAQFTIRRTGG